MGFNSNEELIQAAKKLIADLERQGKTAAAARLKEGLGGLNGLTDGWAAFLAAIVDVRGDPASGLSEDERKTLAALFDGAYFAVYRRRPGELSGVPHRLSEGLLLESPELLLPWTEDCEKLSRVGSPEVQRGAGILSIAWKGHTALGVEADVWYRNDMPSTFLLITREKLAGALEEYAAALPRLIERLGPPHANGQYEQYPGTKIFLPWARWNYGDVTVAISVAERFSLYLGFAVSKALDRKADPKGGAARKIQSTL